MTEVLNLNFDEDVMFLQAGARTRREPVIGGRARSPRREPHTRPEEFLASKTRVSLSDTEMLLGLSKRRILELVDEGRLERVGAGHRKMFTVKSINQYLGLDV